MTAAKSENGWGLLTPTSELLRSWVVGEKNFTGRVGPAGFVLAHWAQWWDESIERITGRDNPDDDHWYGERPLINGVLHSNHESATAIDLNALRHPQHQDPLASFTASQVALINRKLDMKYQGVLVWGGNWSPANVDGMHTELEDLAKVPKDKVRALAVTLVQTTVGRRLIAAQTTPVRWETW